MNFDFSYMHKRWSTWLATILAAASGSLAAYTMLPARVQDMIPSIVLAVMGGIVLVVPWLIPFATSAQQKNIPPPTAGPPANPGIAMFNILLTLIIAAPVFTFVGIMVGRRSTKANKAADLIDANLRQAQAHTDATVDKLKAEADEVRARIKKEYG